LTDYVDTVDVSVTLTPDFEWDFVTGDRSNPTPYDRSRVWGAPYRPEHPVAVY
jgi:hypothetical protein